MQTIYPIEYFAAITKDSVQICTKPDRFDPLAKITTSRTGENDGFESVEYNHLEGFNFAPNEMQEVFLDALEAARVAPTLQNKAYVYDLFVSMIGEYWDGKKEKVEEVIKQAIAS